MSDESKIQEIVAGIGLLDPATEGDFTKGGLPNVEKLEAITGITSITSEERDEAFEVFTKEATTNTGEAADKVAADKEAADKEAAEKEAAEKEAADKVAKEKSDKKNMSKTIKYFVEDGKSISTRKKGILDSHIELKPEYMGDPDSDNTKAAVAILLEKGYIYEATESKLEVKKAKEAKASIKAK